MRTPDTGRSFEPRYCCRIKASRDLTSLNASLESRIGKHYISGVGGRVKRLAGLAEAAVRMARKPEEVSCALCGRLLGHHAEWHHVLPKSEGGTETVPMHPICHRTIHAFVENHEIATSYPTMNQLREREDVRRFLNWIADKPPDFHVPTRRRKTF